MVKYKLGKSWFAATSPSTVGWTFFGGGVRVVSFINRMHLLINVGSVVHLVNCKKNKGFMSTLLIRHKSKKIENYYPKQYISYLTTVCILELTKGDI